MKNILFVIALSVTVITRGQVTNVYFQASGLTCSMCSNAINKSLKKLDFVDKIDADVKTYTFELSFKANSHVDFDKIKRKVEDAGFSISSFVATVYVDNVQLTDKEPIKIGNSKLFFINQESRVLNGEIRIRFLDKGFVSSKEYKSNSFPASLAEEGVYHVSL